MKLTKFSLIYLIVTSYLKCATIPERSAGHLSYSNCFIIKCSPKLTILLYNPLSYLLYILNDLFPLRDMLSSFL